MTARRLVPAHVTAAALVVLGLDGTAAARADETAGTLSPFARGAGSRALGMGGAFVAAADDASALVWNPGALAWVDRLALEASYARLEEAETGEHFAALVVPSWRWGTTAWTLRHLGVSGVERRDERNELVPGDLSSSETELALGYARALAPGVGAGLASKLQRVAVGEQSGTGFGLDAGVSLEARPLLGDRAAWLAPFSLGLSMRNVLEPSQRLDQEAVVDPRVLRVGLGWRRAVGSGATLTLAAGLDHAAAVDARLHAGLELGLGLMSLRGGLDAGHLTAGTSIRWQGLSMDYVYEQRDLGTVQRIGWSKTLGPTVVERREAFRATQERNLAQQLDRAYEQRLAEQVGALVDRAREALAAGRVDDGLEAIAAARALAPQDARAAELEAALLRAQGQRLEQGGDPAGALQSFRRALDAWPADSLAAAGRSRAEAQIAKRAARAQDARGLESAYRLYASGDLAGARAAFRALSAASPSDTTSAAMLRRVERELARRVDDALARVRSDLDAGLLEEAERGIDQARGLGAREADLVTLQTALARERARVRDAAAGTSVTAPVSRAAPTEAQNRQADALYRNGLQLTSRGQSDAAVHAWELALSLNPEHRGARDALCRELLLRGMVAFGRGRFTDAEGHWARVVALDPSNARARGYLERARVQIDRTRELTGAR